MYWLVSHPFSKSSLDRIQPPPNPTVNQLLLSLLTGIGEFLTFGAMVLMILANVGQLTSEYLSSFSLKHSDLGGPLPNIFLLRSSSSPFTKDNVVSRNIRYVSIDTTNLEASLRANTTGTTIENIYANDQGAVELAGNGLKYNYQWGLYSEFLGLIRDYPLGRKRLATRELEEVAVNQEGS